MKVLNQVLAMIRKPAQHSSDPVFGEMTFQQGSWVAYVSFPHAREPVEVSVWGKEGPSAVQHAVWHKLTQGYVELEPLIEKALFDEFMTMKLDDSTDINNHYLTEEYLPENAGEIWKIAFPQAIDVYPAGYSSEYDCRIYYAFPVDREHNRAVFFRNGELVFVLPE